MPTLSVVIPAYNEAVHLGRLLQRIQTVSLEGSPFQLEIIVVDDGSTDDTGAVASSFPKVHVIRQENQGKGAAVQRGVQAATGDYLLVQDADLEYDPADYPAMLRALPAQGWAVVYGSRPKGTIQRRGWGLFPGKHPGQKLGPWLANVLLSIEILVLYQRWISDSLTAYKLYPMALVRELHVRTKGFEADHEMTAKIIRRGIPIYEVPAAYSPRSVSEGKKIRARDGFIAFWTLLKFRFTT